MALILTDVGADALLKIIFINTRATGGNNLTIRLFATNVTPAQTGITYVEATGGGYAAQTLTMGSNWVVNSANDPSDAVYSQMSWTFTGTLTTNPNAYGYYITDADGVVIWAELFSAYVTPVNGTVIRITPKFQLSSGTPN
jgi:hypothetical protein